MNTKTKKYANGGQIAGSVASGALSGAATGAALGSVVPGVGTLIGAGVGALAAGLPYMFNKKEGETVDPYTFSAPSTAHRFAMGGDLTKVTAGGTHEQNPLGGVPINNGASVEEGEVIFSGLAFSNRLEVPGGPHKGKTFAEAAKALHSDRENNPMDKRYNEKVLGQLFEMQESMKPQQAQPQQMALGGIIPNSLLGNAAYLSDYSNFTLPEPSYEEGLLADIDSGFTTANQAGLAGQPQGGGMAQTPENNIFSPLQYAAPVANAIGLAATAMNKPQAKDLNMFNVNTKVGYDEVNMEQLQRDVQSAGGAWRRAAVENSGGNAGNAQANLLGQALNIGKAISSANMQSQLENARNKFQADTTNLGTELQNQQMRSRVADMNDADLQAYRDAMLNSVGAIGTNLSEIGLQKTRANIASNLGNYDVSGNYNVNMLRNQFKKANPNASEKDFQDWLSQNNFR